MANQVQGRPHFPEDQRKEAYIRLSRNVRQLLDIRMDRRVGVKEILVGKAAKSRVLQMRCLAVLCASGCCNSLAQTRPGGVCAHVAPGRLPGRRKCFPPRGSSEVLG